MPPGSPNASDLPYRKIPNCVWLKAPPKHHGRGFLAFKVTKLILTCLQDCKLMVLLLKQDRLDGILV